MSLKFQTKPNTSGWCTQLEINPHKKLFRTGTFLFRDGDVSRLTRKQLNNLIIALVREGFLEVSE